MYTHSKNIRTGGHLAAGAKAALIMLHGRGSSANDIMQLANHLDAKEMAIYAPQATNNSWYPCSFLNPVRENEPALSSALDLIHITVEQAINDGFKNDQIYFIGFSQGACLTLEYIARNAKLYGGVIAFTGGLIGQELNLNNYSGNFEGTPILITTGDPDPHVPLNRVEESVDVIDKMHGHVTLKVYKGKPHTITSEELKLANLTLN